MTAETRQRKEGVLTKVVLQQTFDQVVWSSSIALVKENQPHVIITNVFYWQHKSQYTLQIYSMQSETMPEH